MESQEVAFSFNNSVAGSQARKDVFRKITENGYLLSIKPQGLIWPKKYAGVKSFSYTISTNQIMIRNDNGEIIRKIRFADVLRMEPSKHAQQFTVMLLTVTDEKNNPP